MSKPNNEKITRPFVRGFDGELLFYLGGARSRPLIVTSESQRKRLAKHAVRVERTMLGLSLMCALGGALFYRMVEPPFKIFAFPGISIAVFGLFKAVQFAHYFREVREAERLDEPLPYTFVVGQWIEGESLKVWLAVFVLAIFLMILGVWMRIKILILLSLGICGLGAWISRSVIEANRKPS